MPKATKQPPIILSFFIRFRRPLLLIIALAVLVFGYFAILKNPIRVYQQNYALLGELNNNIEIAKNDLTTSKKFSNAIYQLSPLEKKLLNTALPDQPEDATLVAQLTAMIDKAGFSASNIDVERLANTASNKIVSDHIGRVSVRLKLKGGGYEELKQFLRLAASSLMMIDVNSISFTTKSPVYDLFLVVYYYNKT